MLGELLREAKVWFSVFSSDRLYSMNSMKEPSMIMINMKSDEVESKTSPTRIL